MALVVCCPCGIPLDCDNVELVVTLTCPRCHRDIRLELEDARNPGTRAILTVMEGPHWVGERFVLPVGVDLSIGTAGGNWLSLESTEMSDVHCRLHLTKEGRVSIEDRNSDSGTWIADQRIQRGRLETRAAFRIGEFRLRLDFQSADGAAAPPPAAPIDAGGPPLPILARVTPLATPGQWLIRNRFHVSRSLLIAFAWLAAIFHAGSLYRWPQHGWSTPDACLAGAVILIVLTVAGQRVTLTHRYLKFVCLAALVFLAAVDAAWVMRVSAGACLLLAGCLAILITGVPAQLPAIFAAILGLASITMMTVLVVRSLIDIAPEVF